MRGSFHLQILVKVTQDTSAKLDSHRRLQSKRMGTVTKHIIRIWRRARWLDQGRTARTERPEQEWHQLRVTQVLGLWLAHPCLHPEALSRLPWGKRRERLCSIQSWCRPHLGIPRLPVSQLRTLISALLGTREAVCCYPWRISRSPVGRNRDWVWWKRDRRRDRRSCYGADGWWWCRCHCRYSRWSKGCARNSRCGIARTATCPWCPEQCIRLSPPSASPPRRPRTSLRQSPLPPDVPQLRLVSGRWTSRCSAAERSANFPRIFRPELPPSWADSRLEMSPCSHNKPRLPSFPRNPSSNKIRSINRLTSDSDPTTTALSKRPRAPVRQIPRSSAEDEKRGPCARAVSDPTPGDLKLRPRQQNPDLVWGNIRGLIICKRRGMIIARQWGAQPRRWAQSRTDCTRFG